MKGIEYKAALNGIVELMDDDEITCAFVGVRFENMQRNVGDVCEQYSRHNSGREDERDFPDFESEGYAKMDELDGLSSWALNNCTINNLLAEFGDNDDLCSCVLACHCYIIGGTTDATHSDCDDGEVVVCNAKVLKVLF